MELSRETKSRLRPFTYERQASTLLLQRVFTIHYLAKVESR